MAAGFAKTGDRRMRGINALDIRERIFEEDKGVNLSSRSVAGLEIAGGVVLVQWLERP